MSQRRLKLRFYWANKTVDKFVFRNSKLMFHCHLRALKYLYETIESRGDGQSRDHFILGQAFIMLSPHFWFIWLDRIFFLHYANDSTLTLLRNSLFKNNKQNNFFHCFKKHLKWGDEAMKKVSPIIQCSMTKSLLMTMIFNSNQNLN